MRSSKCANQTSGGREALHLLIQTRDQGSVAACEAK